MTTLPRLDVLIYAHDGRGLGHVSRSAAIGMALRRLFPSLRVLLVTGCKISQELIGPVPLDWLKLPSYETEVVAGKSRGIDGFSNFSDHDLGRLRSEELSNLLQLYRPRVVLCDHTPQGKHKELRAALEAKRNVDTIFVLGVRGVIGSVSQVGSTLSQQLFQKYYHSLFWYGDSGVLGTLHREQLRDQFTTDPVECGYVSRLAELNQWQTTTTERGLSLAGTISIPWLGEKSIRFIRTLVAALQAIGPSYGQWRVFIGYEPESEEEIMKLFDDVAHCILELPGGRYADALHGSRMALIYGGYNSLMDILHLGIPAVVILREMADREQQLHLQKLQQRLGNQLAVCSEEEVKVAALTGLLLQQLQQKVPFAKSVHLDGAERAAQRLMEMLQNS